jgi:hypothetical protein
MFPAVHSEWHQTLLLCCYQSDVHQIHLLSLRMECYFSFDLRAYFGAGLLMGQTGGCVSHYRACFVVSQSQLCHLSQTQMTAGDLCWLFVVSAALPPMHQRCHCYHHLGASGLCNSSTNITSARGTSFYHRTYAHSSSLLYTLIW